MKKYWLSICCCFLLWSCEISYLLPNDNCLKCSYQTEDKKITKEICDDTENEEDQEEMRERMQMEADALGVELNCQLN